MITKYSWIKNPIKKRCSALWRTKKWKVLLQLLNKNKWRNGPKCETKCFSIFSQI